jgi:hypothetical protein
MVKLGRRNEDDQDGKVSAVRGLLKNTPPDQPAYSTPFVTTNRPEMLISRNSTTKSMRLGTCLYISPHQKLHDS